MRRAEGRGRGRVLGVIRHGEIALPLVGGQVDRPLAGAAPGRDQLVLVHVPDRGEGADRVKAALLLPDRDARVEGGDVGEEVVVHELLEGHALGDGDEERGEAQGGDLVLEELGDHLLPIGHLRRRLEHGVDLAPVVRRVRRVARDGGGRGEDGGRRVGERQHQGVLGGDELLRAEDAVAVVHDGRLPAAGVGQLVGRVDGLVIGVVGVRPPGIRADLGGVRGPVAQLVHAVLLADGHHGGAREVTDADRRGEVGARVVGIEPDAQHHGAPVGDVGRVEAVEQPK